MAQEPKRRHSKARKRTRRASIMLQKIALMECPNCHGNMLPHQVCPKCGYYKGVEVQSIKKVTVTKA